MVNIIIPAYNAHGPIRQAISSVGMQNCLDKIQLTIVDDASEEPYDYLLSDYHYMNINILKKDKNSGCGQSRQYGIDHTTCEYFMFLDSDDVLFSCNSVAVLLNKINQSRCDVITSNFYGEDENGEYQLYDHNMVWMHGKIYRTDYIKHDNIRFNETRSNEDSAYNAIIKYSKGNIGFVDAVTYIWKHNPYSITRQNDFLFDGMKEFIDNAIYAVDELLRLHAKTKNIIECVSQYMITLYAYSILFYYENRDITSFMAMCGIFYRKVPSEYTQNDKIYEAIRTNIYRNSIVKNIMANNIIMPISIIDFIKLL